LCLPITKQFCKDQPNSYKGLQHGMKLKMHPNVAWNWTNLVLSFSTDEQKMNVVKSMNKDFLCCKFFLFIFVYFMATHHLEKLLHKSLSNFFKTIKTNYYYFYPIAMVE
jgi:hypothetical protein